MTYTPFSNALRNSLGILAFALSSLSAAAADNWQINAVGSGITGASSVSTVIVGGVGYVQLISAEAGNPYAFTFIENGAYRLLSADGSAPFGANDLTATYNVIGNGNFLDNSALRMTGGRINLYADPTFDFATSAASYGADNGKLVASFNIFDGYVADNQGRVTVNATGISGSFSHGYLFTANGTDMASLPGVQLQLDIRNQATIPDNLIISEIICGMAAACSGDRQALSQQGFSVQDAGLISISAIPEPETVAMLIAGLGLIGGITQRRRKNSR